MAMLTKLLKTKLFLFFMLFNLFILNLPIAYTTEPIGTIEGGIRPIPEITRGALGGEGNSNSNINRDERIRPSTIPNTTVFHNPLAVDIVKMAHCRVLEKLPSVEELNYLVPLFINNNGIARDLIHFLASSERHYKDYILTRPTETIVAIIFDHLMARNPTSTEMFKYLSLVQMNGAQALINELLNSPEYNQVWGLNLIPAHGRSGCFSRVLF
ncbi:MAG: phycobilisome rod-core linker polypeptide [Oligoflexia bacterium]|nr:phycobilisome rod-core linker polypeptide [Oligoflexia bacterium]